VLPLQGLAFFTSGVTGDTIAIIEKLGGTVLQKVVGHLLQTENIKKQLFFVSKPTSRRTHKYILAGALGVPMLNISWVSTINDRFEQYKLSVEQDSSSQTVNSPCPFDSHLFASHRLPLGLSIENGLFVLQRARHAKKWCRPGCEINGHPVFYGLKIALALDKVDFEKKWCDIIQALGGSIVNISSSKEEKDIRFDLALVDALSLPPHVTAKPPRVAKLLNFVARKNAGVPNCEHIPVLDLCWATQCVVQRKKVDFYSNERYRLQSSNAGKEIDNGVLKLFSIKVKRIKNQTRYEVGDSIFFKKITRRMKVLRLDE